MATAAMAIEGMGRLFGGGTLAGRGDAQLVEAFLADRDESAFAAIVARHGPMVLATCRAVLRDPAAADDAFQATFVVLARKAGSVRGRDALGGWLHRVAYRTAVQAARDAARRRHEERKAAEMRATLDVRDDLRDDLRAAIHAEVERLPESLRLPVVLCDLEGRTREQAAEELRWSEWVVRGRLQRGRAKLRHRLTARGLAPTAGLGVAAMAGESLAAVPEALAAVAVRTAVAAVAGRAVAAGVAGLAARTIRRMLAEKIRSGAIVAIAALGVAGSSVEVALMVLPRKGDGPLPAMKKDTNPPARPDMAKADEPTEPEKKTQPKPSPEELRRTAAAMLGMFRGGKARDYRGVVLDPAGRPVAGAKLYLFNGNGPFDVRATTGPDGRFAFSALDANDPRFCRVMAEADGFASGGSGAAEPEAIDAPPDHERELTIKLAEDQPIEGRVVDLEGRPVAGAGVRIEWLYYGKKGDFGPYLRALQAQEDQPDQLRNEYLWPMSFNPLLKRSIGYGEDRPPDATTDKQGKFILKGIGRDRLVNLKIEGPTIRPLHVEVITRPGPPIRVMNLPSGGPRFGMRTYYGPKLDLAASPSRPIEGVVRDRATGEPVAGSTVSSYKLADQDLGNNTIVRAKSDAKGHYKLVGMPRGSGNEVMVIPPAGAPYLPSMVKLPDPPGLGPIAYDLPLDRGVQVEGRVVDEGTGAPVRGWVTYHVAVDNPALKETPAFREMQYAQSYLLKANTEADGKFRLVGFPGRGMLVVETMDRSHPDDGHRDFRQDFVPVVQMFHQAMVEVDIPKGAKTFAKEIRLDPGRVVEGTVVDPEGKPLEGAEVYGLGNLGDWEGLPKTATFKVVALMAGRQDRSLVFRHEGRKLAGWVDVKNEEAGHPTVRLEPWAVATGRMIDEQGNPRAGLTIEVQAEKPRMGGGSITNQPEHVRTDADGRFRVEGLAPGLAYRLFVQASGGMRAAKRIEIEPARPGETRDLGDRAVAFRPAE